MRVLKIPLFHGLTLPPPQSSSEVGEYYGLSSISFIRSGRSWLWLLLTLSWRRPVPYRNQPIDLQSKSEDWFLYDRDLRHRWLNWWSSLVWSSKIILAILDSLWSSFAPLNNHAVTYSAVSLRLKLIHDSFERFCFHNFQKNAFTIIKTPRKIDTIKV